MEKKMSPMKDVKWIVIHCSYTKASQKVTVDDLDNFHQAKGWASVRCPEGVRHTKCKSQNRQLNEVLQKTPLR